MNNAQWPIRTRLRVGIHSLINRCYELIVEAGFGERSHGLVNLGYRF